MQPNHEADNIKYIFLEASFHEIHKIYYLCVHDRRIVGT